MSEESFDWEGVWDGFVMIEQVDERKEGGKNEMIKKNKVEIRS